MPEIRGREQGIVMIRNRLLIPAAATVLWCTVQVTAGGVPDSTEPARLAVVKEASINKKTVKAADTLVVIARLTEIAGKFAPNDAYDYVYIMKYRVLSVEKGAYAEKEILVGHYNPLIARKLIKDKMDPFVDGTIEKFGEGAKHRLTLIEPIERVWNGPVEDEYIDSDKTKYFALKADLLQ